MKCGTRLHNGKLVPIKAEVKLAPSGREYYISGINESGTIIKYIDNDEFKILPKTP